MIMDKEMKPTFKQSSKHLRRRLAHLLVHVLSQALLWQQLTYTQAVFAADNSQAGLPSISTKTVDQYNQIQEENKTSQAGSGSVSKCSGQRTTYDSYTTRQNEFTNYSNQLSSDMGRVIGDAGSQLTNLIGAQQQFLETDQGFTNPTEGIEAGFNAKKNSYLAAQDKLVAARDGKNIAQQEVYAARAACNDRDYSCSPSERQRLDTARSNLVTANQNLQAAQQEYDAANSAYQNATRGMANKSQQAVNATSENAASMDDSHAVSGCGSNFDITSNTTEDCALSGPLFQEDNALTEIANRNVNSAKQLAASREQALFSLELQQKYDADYKLYKLSVDNVTGQVQGRDTNGNGQSNYITKNQVAAKMELSNMKTMSLASAAVRNMICEKHDKSESDPQSYYLFRAAMATWLTAVVNDTDYYNGESSCMANEAITSDTNNDQIQTIERATNLSERQLKSLCLRTRPSNNDVVDTTDSSFLDDNNPDGWRRFNIDSKEETVTYVTKVNQVITGYTDPDTGANYPPLAARCDDYLKKIIGPSYDSSKPRTREYALEMTTDALGVAIQELASKRKKLSIAYANVKKGEAWVKRVKKNIVTMTTLAALTLIAAYAADAICSTLFGAAMCPVAAVLHGKVMWITAIVVALWYEPELMRARSFLAKWRQKLDTAKYFSHMACNFETGHGEQAQLEQLGNLYSERRKAAMQSAANGAINKINHVLYEEISGNKVNTPNSPAPSATPATTMQYEKFEKAIEQINKKIVHVKSASNLQEQLSLLFFKSKSRWQDVTTLFKAMGISILVNALPGNEAIAGIIDQSEIYTTTSSLNIQTGTGNFKYFLTQRNQQFQNLTNDITNQPNHTAANSGISNTGVKNVAEQVILTVDQLAAPYVGGAVGDPLNGIDPNKYNNPDLTLFDRVILMKTGMATPETRVVTIQNAVNLLNSNLNQLNFSAAVAGYNLDQFVSLLETTKKELKITDQGLGETPALDIPTPSNACLSQNANGQMNPDPMCSCRESNSCANFSFPTFNVEVPEALRNSGDSAIKTANNVTNGNLKAANVSGGNLVNQAGRIKELIKSSSQKTPNSLANANALNGASENKINGTLAKIGDNPNSAFNKVRKSLAKNGLSGASSNNSFNSNNKKKTTKNKTNQAKTSGSVAGKVGNWANRKNAQRQESFSLGKGNVNFNLSELSDEEKRRLGLIGDGLTNKDVVPIDQNNSGHVRRHKQANSNIQSSNVGINNNRKKSLFTIISKRYEKTAFPVLLKKRSTK